MRCLVNRGSSIIVIIGKLNRDSMPMATEEIGSHSLSCKSALKERIN
jgi:hypothetical protein